MLSAPATPWSTAADRRVREPALGDSMLAVVSTAEVSAATVAAMGSTASVPVVSPEVSWIEAAAGSLTGVAFSATGSLSGIERGAASAAAVLDASEFALTSDSGSTQSFGGSAVLAASSAACLAFSAATFAATSGGAQPPVTSSGIGMRSSGSPQSEPDFVASGSVSGSMTMSKLASSADFFRDIEATGEGAVFSASSRNWSRDRL